jgi:hypothetical protein
MKKIEFYKAMLPVGTFEKCTGYQFCVGIHELVVHKSTFDGWIVSHIASGMRVTPGLKEMTTRRAAVDLIVNNPDLIAAMDKGLSRRDVIAAEIRLMEYKEGNKNT